MPDIYLAFLYLLSSSCNAPSARGGTLPFILQDFPLSSAGNLLV